MKTDCKGCKWFDKECVMGLECPVNALRCDYYRRKVEDRCTYCDFYLGRGSCLLNLEKECGEDGHRMYTLGGTVIRQCEYCDNLRQGKCVAGNNPKKEDNQNMCQQYDEWPLRPNWGSEAIL